jgi:hypothetical protein
MRARSLKPSLFKNELLAVADPLYTVIFEGLWCAADRDGRLEDRPGKLHIEINPGRGFEGTERSLGWLAENGFVLRYEVAGVKYIQVLNFSKHQKPHVNEKPSVIPPPTCALGSASEPECTTLAESEHDQGTKHLALTPDSGLLTPESPLRGGADAPDTRRPAKDRGTRIPEDFEVTESMLRWLAEKCPHVVEGEATEEFIRYWKAVPGAKGRKLDWVATWQNRMVENEARAVRFQPRGVGRNLSWRPE